MTMLWCRSTRIADVGMGVSEGEQIDDRDFTWGGGFNRLAITSQRRFSLNSCNQYKAA